MSENTILDLKIVQRERAGGGYQFVTFDEMEIDPPAKAWMIKGILARGETSAWIAPPGAMKSALMAEAAVCVGDVSWWRSGSRRRVRADMAHDCADSGVWLGARAWVCSKAKRALLVKCPIKAT